MSHELRFERVFDAMSEEVFDAFIDTAGLEEMYGLDEPGWVVDLPHAFDRVERFLRAKAAERHDGRSKR